MSDIYFSSDLHFGHANVIKHSHRTFDSIEEMNEILIQNWNNTVKPQDEVYFLGDFAWKSTLAKLIRPRLNGRQIFFLQGNHDAAAETIKKSFAWWDQVKMIKIGDQEIWLSHYAHKCWNKMHYGTWHLYGHSHGTLPDDPNSKSMDVGVDAVALRTALYYPDLSSDYLGVKLYIVTKQEDYRPISYDEVKVILDKKVFKSVDHHVPTTLDE
jgi:calcineurin-like phosphoesterase family protein